MNKLIIIIALSFKIDVSAALSGQELDIEIVKLESSDDLDIDKKCSACKEERLNQDPTDIEVTCSKKITVLLSQCCCCIQGCFLSKNHKN
ncbi:hypothetical protein HYV10_03040 [Candidatus Dependentiae bacterium]|nr:hypothetical protein [Candidatus Dependentiae bacterium]